MSEAKKELDSYSNEVCRDPDFMNYLSINDKPTFKEMNNRFNELARGITKGLHKELDKFL